MQPRVSVIMPTYNGERFIHETINSVINQDMADFELIIVDDGSNDNTLSIILDYASNDKRLKVIRRKSCSGGPTIPKNQALLEARSNYICFLDHDDIYDFKKLKIMCDLLDEHQDWVAAFHDLGVISENGTKEEESYLRNDKRKINFLNDAKQFITPMSNSLYECGKDFYKFISLNYAAIHTNTVILSRERLLADPVCFRYRFRWSDDTNLWLRIASQGKIGYYDSVLSYWREHDSNTSSNKLEMAENSVEVHEDNYLVYRKYFSKKDLNKYRNKIASYKFELGYSYYRLGMFSESRTAFIEMIYLGSYCKGIKGLIKNYIYSILFILPDLKFIKHIKNKCFDYNKINKI